MLRKYTHRPRDGYRCNNGYYARINTSHQQLCTDMCIRDPQCLVLSYNVVERQCFLNSEPCALAERHSDFLLMVFRWHEDVQCVHWIPPPNTDIHLPSRLVENTPGQSVHCAVGRISKGLDTYPAHIGGVSTVSSGKAFAVVDGDRVSRTSYDILSVGVNCTFTWIPYTAGDNLPGGAVATGFLSDIGHAYSIREYRVASNADNYGIYILGDSLGYFTQYPGSYSRTDVDILIRV